jgi:hypothetical protein
MTLFRKLASTITLTFGLMASAQAAIIFSDNFDSENGGTGVLNYNSFANWSVTSGTVDLIGNGYFDFFPGKGLYIDLDGSTNNAGIMGRLETLLAGDYTLSFSLAGNQRDNAGETTDVGVSVLAGSVIAQQSYSLNKNDGFTNYSIDFSISDLLAPAEIQITFGALSNDNIGMLLDDVVLEQRVAVAEPASLALLGMGLLGLAAVRRTKV